MDVTVALDESDIEAAKGVPGVDWRRERKLQLLVYVGPVVALLLFHGLNWLSSRFENNAIAEIVFWIGLALLFGSALGSLITYFRIRRAYRPRWLVCEGEGGPVQSPVTYSITEDGIVFEGELGSGRTSWKDVERILEIGPRIHALVRGHRTYVFPKRAFPTEEEASRFLELAWDYRRRAAQAGAPSG